MGQNYGSDRNGLICGYRFCGGGTGAPVTLEETQAWLAAAQETRPGEGDFIWLHFNLSDAAAEAWMRNHLPVVPEFFSALHEGSRSTRIEDADDTLVAVVNDVAYSFAFDPGEIETLWLNVSPHLAVSARLHPLRSIDVLRQAVKDGLRFASSVAFLNRLLHDQGDVLVRIVRQATTQVDTVEDQLLVGRLKHKRAELGQLRRVLVRLQRLLALEPGSLLRLLNRPPQWLQKEDVKELRKSTEEFALIINDLMALGERIKLLQEEIAANLNEQSNRTLFTLTVVTVLALPINIIAGFFGMNVGGVPLSTDPEGFWILVALVATFTLIAGRWAFRKRKDY